MRFRYGVVASLFRKAWPREVTLSRMQSPWIVGLVAVAASFLIGAGLVVWRCSPNADAASSLKLEVPLASLEFRELLDSGPTLRPSRKALGLHGKHVRVVGFMAEMEEPIEGAFYLVPRPMRLDESGGGTGDLPLESILVVVPGAEGKALPQVEGPLEGIGVLDVGNRADDHGRVSNFRLSLDGWRPVAHTIPDHGDRALQAPSQAALPTYAAAAASGN